MDSRSNSYIIQQFSSRYVPNFPLQYSGSSHGHRPQFFQSSNNDINFSPPRDRAFNPQVQIRPPAPTVLPTQIREPSFSSSGQIFNPNRHLSSRLPNFPSNIDCFNYAQRRGEYPLRMQEHDRERYSSAHDSRRSNPAWSSKVLDDHRIRFGSRESNRMKVHRSGGSERFSHRSENFDIGFPGSSMTKDDYKGEGKRGNIEGNGWVPMNPPTSSKQHQRKSAFQRIQKSVCERLEEKPLGFTRTPTREDFEKLLPNGHNSFTSQPSYLHCSLKPKSSVVDRPDYTKLNGPSKFRPRSTRKRIQREYERPHVGKARKLDDSETSFQTVVTLNRSDVAPRIRGKNLQEDAASEDCGSQAVPTLFEATEKDGLMEDNPNSSPSDVRFAQELDEYFSTYVGPISSPPNSYGKLKRAKLSPDSSDSYAKRSRNDAEHSRMEETSRPVLSEDKITNEGSFSVDQEGKNSIKKTEISCTPFDTNVAATTCESFHAPSDLMKNDKALNSMFLDRDDDDQLTKNNVNSESVPNVDTHEVINSNLDLESPEINEEEVDSFFNDGEEKLTGSSVVLEPIFNDEERGFTKSKLDLGTPDSSKKSTSFAVKSNDVENTPNYKVEFANLENVVSEVVSYPQELRSPEIAEVNLTSKGVFTVEAEFIIANTASTRELQYSFSQTPLNEIVLSPEKPQLSKDSKSDEKLVEDDGSSKAYSQDFNSGINEAMKMRLESEDLQNSFNAETQKTRLSKNNQATEHKIAESPYRKSSSEILRHSVIDETRRIVPAMKRESFVPRSNIQKSSPEVLRQSLNDEVKRTISSFSDQPSSEIIADYALQNGSSDDFGIEANEETQVSTRTYQSSVEKTADFASQVCFSEVFQNSANEEIQRTVSNVDRRVTYEKAPDSSVNDETLETIPNTKRESPIEKTADSGPRESPTSQEHSTPSNSSLVSSGSLSSSESIPRSNSLLQQAKKSSNEEPHKDKQPSFKKLPSEYSTKPRTWHRASDSSVPPTTNAPPLSYIRKGNSLIRQPNAASSESLISLGSEEDAAKTTNPSSKSITYVKPKANQLVASVSDIDRGKIPISTQKKPKKQKKLTRTAARKQTRVAPFTKQLVPWKWTSYRMKTLSQSQPTADEDAKPKPEFSKPKYIRIGKGNKLVRATNKRTRILANEKIRWSLHTVRSRMSKKKKYCQFYTRFGKCIKNDGKCPFLHDPSKIAVCTKFLSGLCTDSRCILTHKVMPERMPDCSYFLQNLCNNSCCPYRHVHVDPGAEPCQAFLRGFCADGDECLMKHSYECPTHAETGSCEMGLKCKLHHPTVRSKGLRNQRLGWSSVPIRYFGVIPANVVDSVGVENDEKLPEFITIDDSDDTCFDIEDDVDDQSIFPLRIMNTGQ